MSDKDRPTEECFSTRLVRIETVLEEREKALSLARDMLKDQLDLALKTLNERLEGMNEFRRQLERQESTFLKRVDLEHELKATKELREAAIKSLNDKVEKAMESANHRISTIEKIFYVGFGILLTAQVVFHIFWKG